MAFPVTGYLVFILYIDTNKTHTPQFETMDDAELFANEMRVATAHCIISEPYPVVLTEHKKKALLEI
jgi:hypothetical protein